VRYNVYLRDHIVLRLYSSDRSRVELAARLLRLAGVDVRVQKVGGRDVWYIYAYTDMLATGHEELRETLAEIVKRAVENGWIDASKAEGWLKKLEEGLTLREGWPKYLVRLKDGALMIRFSSTDPDSIEQEARRLRDMGLKEGNHFTVKMPEEGRYGYVSVLKEGLAYAARLSVHGSGEQQRLAAEFVDYILRRAWEAGEEVYGKAREIIEEGKSSGSQKLEGFEKEVEVDGKKHVVKVIGGYAEFKRGRDGRKLLRIKIKAEVGRVEGEHTIVDRVVREYTITFGRYGEGNAAVGHADASVNAPGGREADAERLAAVIKALTGREPRIRRMKNGQIKIVCGREHLEGFRRYAELADAIERWLEETSR